MAMFPTYQGLVDLDVIVRAKNFTGMHPTMQERVRALMEDSGGKVGWGQGVRTPQQQLQLFLERHVPDPKGTITWNGQTYSQRPGVAAAVPPGRSMHEVGLAADMAGDFAWLGKNVGRFGLMTFAEVNHEPWHVQPVELPKGRQQYEQQGSKWGAYPTYNAEAKAPEAAAKSQPAAPPSAASAAASPMLTPALVARPGDTGPAARLLMEALIAQGVHPDAAASRDGSYGADDKELVLQFQDRDHGLTVDGEVGPQTWSKLLATVNPGETGAMVKVLQTALIVRSLIHDAETNLDGIYGPATQQRVRDFQKVSGIDPIAIVGPSTWTALLGVKSKVNVVTHGLPEEDDGVVDLDDLDFLAALDGLPGRVSSPTTSTAKPASAAGPAPVRLTALPAACGDCLVVEYGSGTDVHRLLIDGGLGSKYDIGLGAYLSASTGEPQFDIVIVTHVDRDHIDGVIHALLDQHLQSADIWFNGRDEIDGLINGNTRGVRQGDELSALIPTDRRNRIVEGKAIHVPPTGPVVFELPGGARCTLLSPTPKRLEKLFDRWPDQMRVVANPADDLMDKLADPLTRGIGEFGEDSSLANGSSIAVLFETEGAALLLTGDAYAADLEVTIGQLLAQRNEKKLHVDLFKLSHHGSRQNMTDGLLDLVEPGAVLVCTDGSKFHHPDEDALGKVRSHYPDVPIHFTDDTEHIRLRAATVGARPPEVLPLQLHLGTRHH